MDIQENFKKIGNFNVSEMQNWLAQLEESDWMKYIWRQQRYKAHINTQTIPLLYDADFRFTKPTKHAYYATLENELSPLLDTVASVYNHQGYPQRLLLTRLAPKSEITPHQDKGPTLRWVHRIHVPLQTNKLVTFNIDDEILFLREGEIWEINNCRVHAVKNASSSFRIHLIIDWVTPSLVLSYLQEQYRRNVNKTAVTTRS